MSRETGVIAGDSWRRALVVFADRAELWWLRFLKRGFRHCFVALWDGRHWLTVDPLSHRTEIRLHADLGAVDLAAFYRARGMTVVETEIGNPPTRAQAWRPFTCVEAAKRILGIRAPWALTPWQLYRRLTESEYYHITEKNSLTFPPGRG